MKKYSFSFLLILAFIFTGCTSYSITKYFDKNEFYNKAIQFTKKADIKENGNVLAMINVTYLNSVSKEFDNDKENFVVGIFIVEDEKEFGLKHPEYVLLLNGEKATNVKRLKDDNPIINDIPLKNHWAKYYFVSFNKEKVELFEEQNYDLEVSFENILERAKYLALKEEEKEMIEKLSILDEVKASTLNQKKKASVTFLKEL